LRRKGAAGCSCSAPPILTVVLVFSDVYV
jgi:hypothetical protein